MNVKITAKANASSRTKNRIRENGNLFTLKRVDNATCFHNRECALLEAHTCTASNGQGGKEHWLGWIPTDEIEMESLDLPAL